MEVYNIIKVNNQKLYFNSSNNYKNVYNFGYNALDTTNILLETQIVYEQNLTKQSETKRLKRNKND